VSAAPHDTTTLDTARQIAAHGIRVVPIKPGEKRPPMPRWQDAATSDASLITTWFTGPYRGHGLGVATGRVTNEVHLFVLDVDDHGNGASGFDSLEDLVARYGPLPDTVEVLTGSGGKHLYFWSPVEIRNDAGKKLGPGLDIRGEGGQVVAPPTIHPNGRPYEWSIGYGIDEIAIADAPEWLIAKLTHTPAPTVPTPRTTDPFLAGDSIADAYTASTTWDELLGADGWTLSRIDTDGIQHWVRPGKNPSDGTSATVNYKGLDILKVFTSSIAWLPEGVYTRFRYYAHRHHGGDMSAAARTLAGTVTARQVAAGADDEWGEPIPLIDDVATPSFPVEVLPAWMADYVAAVADDLQVAVDLPANLALGALAVAVLGNSTVDYPRQNWTQPLNLYIAVVLPPSAGKSPAKSAIFKVLEELEHKRIGLAAANLADHESERRIKEKAQRANEEKAAKSKGVEGDAAREEARALAAEIALMAKPASGKLLVDDVTTEALGVELADAGGAIAVVSAEGGLFDRIAGLYSDQIANMDLYLEGWGGGRYSVSRIGRPPILVPRANLCVVTTVQPAVLDVIGGRRDFAGRGLTARFLITCPPSNVGRRDRLRPSKATTHIRKAYESAITDIADTCQTGTPVLRIEGTGSDTFALWDQSLEDRLGPGEDLEDMAEWVGKLRACVLRVAALLHLAHGHGGTVISSQTMEAAITLGNYYLAHAQAVMTKWGVDGRVVQAQRILEWARRGGRSEFSARDVQRSNNRTFTSVEDTRAPLELLIERGWIRPLSDGPLVLGRRGVESTRFVLRPDETTNPHDMHDMHDNSGVDGGQLSCMSCMSPKDIKKEESLTHSLHKDGRPPGDMHDMHDNPGHWSGLL
jgi:hypothetical protein